MDQGWMYGLTSADMQYLMGINTFITAAKAYAEHNPRDQRLHVLPM
jgi:hypothetical protein